MSTYKVIQDIEAEDKLVGPLSLRQFIYALIAAVCIYFTVLLFTKGLPWLTPVFILPALFCIFFAVPWSSQQPTEVWALAKIRFFLKPRKRIWDQTGVKDLVTVTVPKKIERHLTNGLDQTEVKSRLSALANTLDSRGWAVKNVNVNMSQSYASDNDDSDRLVTVSNLPQEVPNFDVSAADDILDENNNSVAHQFDTMITTQARNRRQNIIQHMQEISQQQAVAAQQVQQAAPQPVAAAGAQTQPVMAVPAVPVPPSVPLPQPMGGQAQQVAPQDYWFMDQSAQTASQMGQAYFQAAPAIQPGTRDDTTTITTTPEEEAVAERALEANQKQTQQAFGHLKTLQPVDSQAAQPVQSPLAPVAKSQPEPAQISVPIQAAVPVTAAPDPAIIDLASNNDLNVATLARQAKKDKQAESDEVVVSLH